MCFTRVGLVPKELEPSVCVCKRQSECESGESEREGERVASSVTKQKL
jgi:hypothetical protein